jgi:hypothetical protein
MKAGTSCSTDRHVERPKAEVARSAPRPAPPIQTIVVATNQKRLMRLRA